MAATRIIPLHINKGKTLATTLEERTNYSKNAEKTEDGKYISAYECDPKTVDEDFLITKKKYDELTGRKRNDDRIAYQIRQSFVPGEVTPEQANKIGYELAMRWTKGKHAFIVATHTDRAHIHNHIIYNSTSLDGKSKWKDFSYSAGVLAKMSDFLCIENGLSVIEKSNIKTKTQKEKRDYPKKLSHRDEICAAIDKALLKKPQSFDELLSLLVKDGYELKNGKHPSLKGKGQERFIRFRSLGDGYTVEDLTAAINGSKKHEVRKAVPQETKKVLKEEDPRMKFLINIQEKINEGKGGGYVRWATIFNLKQAAKAMMFVNENNIAGLDDLQSRVKLQSDKTDSLLTEIKSQEARMQEIAVLKNHLINYAKSKEVFAQYKASKYSKDFFEKHRDVLTLRNAAKAAFSEYEKQHRNPDGSKVKLPTVKELSVEYSQLLEQKKKNYSLYKNEKNQTKEYVTAQRIIETMLSDDNMTAEDKLKNLESRNKKY